MINIAMDGPVGAGKSTVARECAKRLGFIYVDTGALYRACGLFCKRSGVKSVPENAKQIGELLRGSLDLGIKIIDGVQHVYINGEDVSGEIRLPEISMEASRVSALAPVREFLLDTQRRLAAENNVIMDGRDIGTVILPNAQLKIFITAKSQIRAKRRFDELCAKGVETTFEQVLADLEQRDYNDTHRENAPLRQAQDAILLDTSELSFEQTVEAVLKLARETLSGMN